MLHKTGAPWRDVPRRYGSWKTVSNRFYRWRKAGIWQRVLAAVQQRANTAGQVEWQTHRVDSTVIRAHQHAADAKGGQAHEALGRSRGGFTTKLHLRVDSHGKPLVMLLTPGERHDSQALVPLLDAGAIKRMGRGRPRSRPKRVVGDKS